MRFPVRYEALFAAAFIAGLLGAVSQQNVAPATRTSHDETPLAAASAMPAPLAMPATAAPKQLASLGPTTAREIAAQAKPKQVVKVAKKVKPKPKPEMVAEAPQPEHHGWLWRLFHKSPDGEKVASAEAK